MKPCTHVLPECALGGGPWRSPVSGSSRRCAGRDKEPGMTDHISPKQFHESEGVEDWRVVGDGACAYFRTGSFAASARLVQAISQLPDVEDYKPDVELRRDGVTVRLITYAEEYYGMRQRHVATARRLSTD